MPSLEDPVAQTKHLSSQINLENPENLEEEQLEKLRVRLLNLKRALIMGLSSKTYGILDPKLRLIEYWYDNLEKLERLVGEMVDRVTTAKRYWQSEEGTKQMLKLGLNPDSIIECQETGPIVVGLCEQLNPLPTLLYPSLPTNQGNAKAISELEGLMQLINYLPPGYDLKLITLCFQQMSDKSVTNTAYFLDSYGKKIRIIPSNFAKSMSGKSMHNVYIKRETVDKAIKRLANDNPEVAKCLLEASDTIFTQGNKDCARYLDFMEECNGRYMDMFLNTRIPYYYLDENVPGKIGGFFRYHVNDPRKFFNFLDREGIVKEKQPTVRILQKNGKFERYYWDGDSNSFIIYDESNLKPDTLKVVKWKEIKTNEDILILPLMLIEYLLMYSGLLCNIYPIDDGTFTKVKFRLRSNIRKFSGNKNLQPLITTVYEITSKYWR